MSDKNLNVIIQVLNEKQRYVNIARVLYLLTNNVKKENYHFFYKGALEKQDKRIDWFINNIINKRKQYLTKVHISTTHM